MAQVVATRSIHSSLLCPSTGSSLERFDKLKPSSFALKILSHEENKRKNKSLAIARRSSQIVAAQRSASVEPEVIPVSPEDVPQREEQVLHLQQLGDTSVGVWSKPTVRRKTKIV